MSKFVQQDLIDERGQKILSYVLDETYFLIDPKGTKDKVPDIDGDIRLRGGDNEYLNKYLDYQLKSTKNLKKNKHRFSRKDIDYQLTANRHTVMLVVDILSGKVYWYYFKDHLDELLLDTSYKTKTIDLTNHELDDDQSNLFKKWEKIASSKVPTTPPSPSEVEYAGDAVNQKVPSQIRSVLNYDVISEHQSELDKARDLINEGKPTTALSILKDLEDRVWHKTDDIVRFRILTNIGASKLSLGQDDEASKLFIQALQYNPKDEKALSNAALANLLMGDNKESIKYSNMVLEKNPGNSQALSVFLQASTKREREKFVKNLNEVTKNSAEVYFSLGFVEQKLENYEQAETYLRKALDLDKKDSLEISTLLAGVLIEKNIPLLKRLELEGLSKKKNHEVEEAIGLLEKAWKKIENTELAKPRVNWLVNRSFAKRIIGDFSNAYVDAKRAFELDPDNLKVIRNLAVLCYEMEKFDDAIELLNQFKFSEDFPEATLLMAVIERERKNFKKSISLIKKQLSQPFIDEKNREDGLSLLIETYFKSGEEDKAGQYIDSELKVDEKDVVLRVFKSRFYQEKNEKVKAIEEIIEAHTNLTDSSTYFDKFLLAGQLYRLQQFEMAQEIYEEIIDKSVYTEMLHRLLLCYFETNSYAKALAISRSITKKEGAIESVLNIQAAILEEQGDLDGVMEAQEMILKTNPKNSSARIQIGQILLRQNKYKELDEYLENTDFEIDNLSMTSRYKLGYMFSNRKKAAKFLEIIYETRRSFFDNDDAHIDYVRLFFTGTSEIDQLVSNTVIVENNTAVFYKHQDGRVESYVIDERDNPSRAMNEILPSEELAKKLIGKKIGDKVEISKRVIVEITEIKNKYVHALHESLAMHQARFNDTPELQSIQMGSPKKEGELPAGFEEIEKAILEQHSHMDKIEELYKNKQITIGAFANLIGKNLIETWGGMASDENIGINYSRGDLEERVSSLTNLKKESQLVVDPIALLTIHSLKIKKLMTRVYGKLGVSQTTLDLITERIAHLEPLKNKGYMVLGGQKGKLTRHEVTPDAIKRNIKFLSDLGAWVNENCQILHVSHLEGISKIKKEQLEKAIGASSADSVLISRGKKKILFSDDYALRELGRGEYKIKSVWTQVLLMNALGKGYITQEEYDDYTISLVSLNYYYTSVSGKNLVFALKKSAWKITEPFTHALRMLEPDFSDTSSAVNVSIDFLFELYIRKILPIDENVMIPAILDRITMGRGAGEVLGQFQKRLRGKFNLMPMDLEAILLLVEQWKKGRVL